MTNGLNLPVTFAWESEDDPPAIGRGRVTVSFHPVSGVGGDTFEVGPRRCLVS